MLKPIPERQAILDVDEFIQQCQRDGLHYQQVINSLYKGPHDWDLVKYLLLGWGLSENFGNGDPIVRKDDETSTEAINNPK